MKVREETRFETKKTLNNMKTSNCIKERKDKKLLHFFIYCTKQEMYFSITS